VPVEGLKIRRAELDDCLDLYEMFHGPKVYTGTMQLPYPSREQWRKRLASEEASGYYNLVAVVEDRVIGMITVETFPNKPRRRHVGRIGISVDDDWQGKGVGTAMMAAAVDLADNWLNLTRVELTVYTDNAVGIALYEKFGFEMEGTHRCFAFRNGEYVDAYSMARIK
jgi:L-phenylalanine/L-methionine N-acetyltransferase